jgi:hypothetical protein
VQNTHAPNPVVRALAALLILVLCTCAWFLAGAAWAQAVRSGLLNGAHPMQRGLMGWWLVEPTTAGGATWWNVLQRWPGTLTTMGAGTGWSPTSRAGWYGEMRFDGTVGQSISLGTDSTFDFPDQTFTVCANFRSTNAGQGYIASKRSTGSIGGWAIRLNTGGVLLVRVEGGIDRPTVGTYTNGLWHSVVAVITTDTAGAGAGNAITIYMDGVLEQDVVQGSGPYGACPSCNFTFGNVQEGGNTLLGALDNIRIYRRGLSATEALAYHRDKPPDFGGLVLPEPIALSLPPSAPLKRRITIE